MANNNDKLILSTMSTTGKFSSRIQKGAAYLTVQKTFNGPSNQVAVQVSHSSGVGPFRTNIEHPTALVNLTFADGSVWSGTFDELFQQLFAPLPKMIEGTNGQTFTLQCVTKDFIFYGCEEESDENANTMMFDKRTLELRSNNYFAYTTLFEVAEAGKDIEWASDLFRQWQKKLKDESPKS